MKGLFFIVALQVAALFCFSEAYAKAQRIVSLTLGTDEILLSLVSPDRILAVTKYVDDENISHVGHLAKGIPHRVTQASSEIVVSLKPDLVLAARYSAADVLTQLKQLGLRILILDEFSSIEGIKRNIRRVAEAVEEEQKAEQLIAAMEKRIQNIATRVKGAKTKPGVLSYDIAGWSAGSQTTFDEIVRLAGGRNLGAESGLKGHPKISMELVVALNPDVIILNAWYPDEVAKNEVLLTHPALRDLSAIRNKRVYFIPGKHLTTVSHHIAEAVAAMAQALHPALFSLPSVSE